jgi:hypothetical protein
MRVPVQKSTVRMKSPPGPPHHTEVQEKWGRSYIQYTKYGWMYAVVILLRGWAPGSQWTGSRDGFNVFPDLVLKKHIPTPYRKQNKSRSALRQLPCWLGDWLNGGLRLLVWTAAIGATYIFQRNYEDTWHNSGMHIVPYQGNLSFI